MIEDRRLEVLSPAGDLTTLRTAVDAGADAVYFGGELFGARAFAHNFTIQDAAEGIGYAHSRGKRAYLTVNTLLKSIEIEKKVYDYLKSFYEAGIDAVLVQDIGLMQLVRDLFPQLPLHISTQVNVTSVYGALFFKEFGARRIVLSRELTLPEISEIHQGCDIELECFAHGALCMSYSGQCLMSSMIGGRSGNRGRCAQPCRKCYELKGDGERHGSSHLLSLKDLCTLGDIYDLYTAGCSSLKIEGRMKSPDYVAATVSAYRWAADLAMSGERADSSELREKKSQVLSQGTRGGGTGGYLHQRNSPSMISGDDSAFRAQKADAASSLTRLTEKISASATLTARIGRPLMLTITAGERSVSKEASPVDRAKKPSDIEKSTRDKIVKTGDERIAIEAVDFDCDFDAFVPAGAVKELRRQAVYELLGGIRIERSKPLDFAPVKAKKRRIPQSRPLLITCQSEEQLREASAFKPEGFDLYIAINYELYQRMDADSLEKKRYYLCLPDILRAGTKIPGEQIRETFAGLVAFSYDEIGYIREELAGMDFITDQRLYSYSDRSREALLSFGASYITAPAELNEKELSHLDETASLIGVYGRIPVMVTAACQHKNASGCDHRQVTLYLKDERKASFPVINFCSFCTNVIYNSLPTSLLPFTERLAEMGFAGMRLDFTTEGAKEVREVFSSLLAGDGSDSGQEVTRGHFHRGVE